MSQQQHEGQSSQKHHMNMSHSKNIQKTKKHHIIYQTEGGNDAPSTRDSQDDATMPQNLAMQAINVQNTNLQGPTQLPPILPQLQANQTGTLSVNMQMQQHFNLKSVNSAAINLIPRDQTDQIINGKLDYKNAINQTLRKDKQESIKGIQLQLGQISPLAQNINVGINSSLNAKPLIRGLGQPRSQLACYPQASSNTSNSFQAGMQISKTSQIKAIRNRNINLSMELRSTSDVLKSMQGNEYLPNNAVGSRKMAESSLSNYPQPLSTLNNSESRNFVQNLPQKMPTLRNSNRNKTQRLIDMTSGGNTIGKNTIINKDMIALAPIIPNQRMSIRTIDQDSVQSPMLQQTNLSMRLREIAHNSKPFQNNISQNQQQIRNSMPDWTQRIRLKDLSKNKLANQDSTQTSNLQKVNSQVFANQQSRSNLHEGVKQKDGKKVFINYQDSPMSILPVITQKNEILDVMFTKMSAHHANLEKEADQLNKDMELQRSKFQVTQAPAQLHQRSEKRLIINQVVVPSFTNQKALEDGNSTRQQFTRVPQAEINSRPIGTRGVNDKFSEGKISASVSVSSEEKEEIRPESISKPRYIPDLNEVPPLIKVRQDYYQGDRSTSPSPKNRLKKQITTEIQQRSASQIDSAPQQQQEIERTPSQLRNNQPKSRVGSHSQNMNVVLSGLRGTHLKTNENLLNPIGRHSSRSRTEIMAEKLINSQHFKTDQARLPHRQETPMSAHSCQQVAYEANDKVKMLIDRLRKNSSQMSSRHNRFGKNYSSHNDIQTPVLGDDRETSHRFGIQANQNNTNNQSHRDVESGCNESDFM